MTKHPGLFAALAAPFDANEVKVFSKTGKQIHYVTARTVMNRLDSVLGPENWWDEYAPHESSVLCRLTVRLPDGSALTKADAGGYAGMADSGDDDKSGYSDAFKRAAVKFGVARYLYRDGVPSFVTTGIATTEGVPSPVSTPCPDTRPPGKGPLTQPTAPADLGWVHNAPDGPAAPIAQNGPPLPGNGRVPRTGKHLFGWCKDMEQRHDVGLIKYLNQWAKLQDFPGRMVEWDADQVALAYAEASRKLGSLQTAGAAP